MPEVNRNIKSNVHKYASVFFFYLQCHKCLQQSESAISWSTTFGSASVLVSPSSPNCLEAIFLRILLIIFPLLVFGRPGAQWILSGAANAPIWNLNHFSSVRLYFVLTHKNISMISKCLVLLAIKPSISPILASLSWHQ